MMKCNGTDILRRVVRRVNGGTLLALLPLAIGQVAAEDIDFVRDVQPILAAHCFACHGPDKATRKANLRLDRAEETFRQLDSGLSAVVPGELAASEMWRRIRSQDDDVRMPPPSNGPALDAAQIDKLGEWIRQGAPYPEHWSFVPIRRPPLPDVSLHDWPREQLDYFVLAGLEQAGMTPSPPADRVTLLRRVTWDLTGLPPTNAERDAFVLDRSVDAYERVVDRLLDSPAHAEHRARYWLDAARYADTHGLQLDNQRTMWPYRDWVIRAFQENMPFDQFTLEQLAGDLLPDRTRDQQIATGFVRCHVTTNEGGSIPEEVFVRNTVDRVETFGTVWLGLTLGCASCHDHKYDPISQREFYELYAFFNSSAEEALDGDAARYPPVIEVLPDEISEQLAKLDAEVANLKQLQSVRIAADETGFRQWLENGRSEASRPPAPPVGLVFRYSADAANDESRETVAIEHPQRSDRSRYAELPRVFGATESVPGRYGEAVKLSHGSVLQWTNAGTSLVRDVGGPMSWCCWVRVNAGHETKRMDATLLSKLDADGRSGFQLQWLDGRIVVMLTNRMENITMRLVTAERLPVDRWWHLCVTCDGREKSAGVNAYVNGESAKLQASAELIAGSIDKDGLLRIGPVTADDAASICIDEAQLYDRVLPEGEIGSLAGRDVLRELFEMPANQLTSGQEEQLREHYYQVVDPTYLQLQRELRRTNRRREQLWRDNVATTLVMEEVAQPRPSHVLIRGRYDQPGERVGRDVPSVLPQLPTHGTVDRLMLARWLTDPTHPLTARVIVNRLWSELTGAGIVSTTGDFGVRGAAPSNPRLLDWLASELVDNGWNHRALEKTIVMSATYQQSSHVSLETPNRDPNNTLCGRANRYRWDAEMIRDGALSIAGILNRQVGGPSVKPYQPPGIWESIAYPRSDTRSYVQDHGPKLYRRSIYTFWKRSAAPPAMTLLDAPSRETCTVQRLRTNSPTAALPLMNDVQFVEAARLLAQRILLEGGRDDSERLTWSFRTVLSRTPSPRELQLLRENLDEQREHFRVRSEDALRLLEVGEQERDGNVSPQELAAWTMVANLLLNLDETLTRE